MSFHTIQALHYVSFPSLADQYTMVEKIGLHLATDRTYTQNYVRTNFGATLGPSQVANLLSQNAHLMFQATWIPPHLAEDTAAWSIRVQIQQSMLFLQSLWLVKDNSVNASEVFFTTQQMPGGDLWTHATPPLWFFTADCKLRETSFSMVELEQAITYYRSSSENSDKAPYDAYRPAPSVAAVRSRIGRGLLAVRHARATDDLGLKCAFYCVCFEAILSTDRTAAAHQIAERTAILIGNPTNQRTIYQDIKRFYRGRSTVLHGSELKPQNLKEIGDRVVRCDDYLRRTILRVMNDPELRPMFDRHNREDLDSYFLKNALPN